MKFFFQKLLKAEAYRRVRMYNLQSAKRLCLGRNLTGDSTCPSTRDGEKRCYRLKWPFYRNWVDARTNDQSRFFGGRKIKSCDVHGLCYLLHLTNLFSIHFQ